MKNYLFLFLVFCVFSAFSQPARNGVPGVFLDCQWGCDQQYLKSTLTYLNFMRDRADADILVQQTGIQNGGGGTEFTLLFFGRRKFAGQQDTLRFHLPPAASDTEIRQALLRHLERGLLPYLLQTPLAERISFVVDLEPADTVAAEPASDPWNFWTFSVRTNVNFNGQEVSRSMNLFGRVDISRVSEHQKTAFNVGGDYGRNTFQFEDTLREVYENGGYFFNASEVLAIDNHWSYGFFGGGRQAQFNNLKMSTYLQSGIEYNIFPYVDVARRQLRLRYFLGSRFNSYFDETVYFKTEEWLWEQVLAMNYKQLFQWGDFNMGFRYSNYLHDWSLNRTHIFIGLELNLFRGFRFNVYSDYGVVHNQVELPSGGATKEEALLQIRQLQTGYNYGLHTGVRYTFGSIYSNVINPRFSG
ncbi:MAG: hypothetical protein EP344_15885 [Bacteroidetes bacterium]|nr:MAG: hypothetical protein EP344_15885 [Bacteroidota bacterium]